MGKLWCLAEASMLRVEHLERRFLNRINYPARDLLPAPGERLRLRNCVFHHLRLLHNVAMLLFVRIGNAQQHPSKAGASVAIARGKISAAIKRLAIGREKRRERPSALPADRLHRRLVANVDVRTLVAVHLHRDEVLIHDRGNFRIVIRLAVHHMAPVAPHRANIEQHGLVLALRRSESFRAPLSPLNGLMHSRAQVSGRSAGEGVEGSGGHKLSLYGRAKGAAGESRTLKTLVTPYTAPLA